VQQLGRTHRSNQLQPPRYVILFTDVAGEHRFAGAVAKRLEQLGALTHGDRHAACQDALASFNVDDKCAPAHSLISNNRPCYSYHDTCMVWSLCSQAWE
jgi:hypothetical protein